MRSRDLSEFGVVDHVIDEPAGGAHREPRQMASRLKTYLTRTLKELSQESVDSLVEARYMRFRQLGVYLDPAETDA